MCKPQSTQDNEQSKLKALNTKDDELNTKQVCTNQSMNYSDNQTKQEENTGITGTKLKVLEN